MSGLEAWAASEEAVELLLQFRRLDRQLEGLPGIRGGLPEEVAALILGVPPARLRASLLEFDRQVQDAAAGLRRRDDVTRAVGTVRHHLAIRRVVCFGDSITADRRSWAEQLAVLLGPEVEVVNRGRAGDTTTDLVNRFRLAVAAAEPDLVVILTGTNDARRHRASASDDSLGAMVLSDEATLAGALELDRLTRAVTGRPALWLTPPPVSPQRLARHPSPLSARAAWDPAAIAAKRHLLLSAFVGACTDLGAVFEEHGAPDDLLMADGLHPDLAGQTVIAAAALAAITAVATSGRAGTGSKAFVAQSITAPDGSRLRRPRADSPPARPG